jgi:hypothetical protein
MSSHEGPTDDDLLASAFDRRRAWRRREAALEELHVRAERDAARAAAIAGALLDRLEADHDLGSTGVEDESIFARLAGFVLGRAGPGAAQRVADGVRSRKRAVHFPCAVALKKVLADRHLAAKVADRCVEGLCAAIAPRRRKETELYEACFDALVEAGERGTKAIPFLREALGLELSGMKAGHALSCMGKTGRLVLVEALRDCRPVRGGWSGEDWKDKEPRDEIVPLFEADDVPTLAFALASFSDNGARYFVCRALEHVARTHGDAGRARVAAAEDTLLALLEDPACDPELTAAAAIDVLGLVGTMRAVPTLERFVEKTTAAADAISTIRDRCS